MSLDQEPQFNKNLTDIQLVDTIYNRLKKTTIYFKGCLTIAKMLKYIISTDSYCDNNQDILPSFDYTTN